MCICVNVYICVCMHNNAGGAHATMRAVPMQQCGRCPCNNAGSARAASRENSKIE